MHCKVLPDYLQSRHDGHRALDSPGGFPDTEFVVVNEVGSRFEMSRDRSFAECPPAEIREAPCTAPYTFTSLSSCQLRLQASLLSSTVLAFTGESLASQTARAPVQHARVSRERVPSGRLSYSFHFSDPPAPDRARSL